MIEKGNTRTAKSSIFLLFPVLWAFCFWGGCTPQEQTINTQQLENTAHKEDYLRSLLHRRYQNPSVHCELARLYHSEGQWDKAEYHFNLALGFDPAHRKAQAAYIKMWVDRDQPLKADELLAKYTKQLYRAPAEMVKLAQALADEGLDGYALTCFQKALAADPRSPEANKQMGLYHLAKNNLPLAKEYLTRSFEINPNQPDVAGHLGRLGVVVEVPHQYRATSTDSTPEQSGT